LNISERGKGLKGNAIFYSDLAKNKKDFKPIIANVTDDNYGIIDEFDGRFLIETDAKAPNRKIVQYDSRSGKWTDVIPEKDEPLNSSGTAGGKLFVTYLKDVTTRAYVYSLTGKLENEVPMPGLGSAGGFGGRNDDKFVFYSYTSFNSPPTIYKYDIASRKSSVFRTVDIPGFKADDYEVKQVFFNSKDGTRVPMFLTYKKGLKLNGQNPTILYGYGGFNITIDSSFSALRVALL